MLTILAVLAMWGLGFWTGWNAHWLKTNRWK